MSGSPFILLRLGKPQRERFPAREAGLGQRSRIGLGARQPRAKFEDGSPLQNVGRVEMRAGLGSGKAGR